MEKYRIYTTYQHVLFITLGSTQTVGEGADCFLKGQKYTQSATFKAVFLDTPFPLLLSAEGCARSFLPVSSGAGGECADMRQHCPPSDNARPYAASAASLVTFTKPVSDRNVRMVCNIWKEQ